MDITQQNCSLASFPDHPDFPILVETLFCLAKIRLPLKRASYQRFWLPTPGNELGTLKSLVKNSAKCAGWHSNYNWCWQVHQRWDWMVVLWLVCISVGGATSTSSSLVDVLFPEKTAQQETSWKGTEGECQAFQKPHLSNVLGRQLQLVLTNIVTRVYINRWRNMHQ